MLRRNVSLLHCSVVLVTAIALAAIGFAHRTAQPALTPELTAYVAAGGDLADICGLTEDGGPQSTAECEACRLIDGVAQIDRPCTARSMDLGQTAVLATVARRIAEACGLDPARLVRAPPQV